MSTITAQIQLRRDTSANWTTNNPVLLAGEIALTTDVFYAGTDQPRQKIGNGVDTWLNLDYIPEGGNAYPENLYLTVVNKTGDNLLATGYKVLKVQDAQGQRLAVDYALADSDANSADTIGVVYENIDNNQTGKIVVIGELTGLNTTGSLQNETWADGDLLFLSPFIDGGITNIRPTAPNHGVIIGYVVHSNSNNGKIYIKIDNGYEIGELHDCYLPSPSNNDGIFWSSGTNRYENKSVESVLGYSPVKYYSKTANSSALTGTTNNTLVDSLLIPANSLKIGIGKISLRNVWTTTLSTKTVRIYFNTSASLTGATLIGTFAVGTAGLSVDMGRILCFKSLTNFEVYNSSSSVIANEQVLTAAISTITYSSTVNNYIIVAFQHANSGDSGYNSFIQFEN